MLQYFHMLLLAFVILAIIALSVISIFSIKRLKRTEDQLKKNNKELSRRLYELSVSQEVASKIGYSLNVEGIVESIVATAERLLSQSAIAYALVDDISKTITVKVIQNDYVGPHFIERLKEMTLDTIYKGLPKDGHHIIETVEKRGVLHQKNYFDGVPASYFSVPVIVGGKFVGAITVASSEKNAFSEEDADLFKQIVENATSAVSNLESVIKTEKGKLDSFLFSLTSGALLFLVESEVLRLVAINSAAKQFLHITGDLDTSMVIARFGMHYDLVQDIKDALKDKKSMLLHDVTIYERYFKIYLNPVFISNTEKVIGVSVTMEDVTLERDIEQMRETFTSMVVHELRAPLTSIKGASNMLLSGKLKIEDTNKMLHIIHDSTERMLMDIGDILDVAKLAAGKFSLNKSLGDLNTLVKDKVLAFSFIATERRITINTDVDSHIPQIVFDTPRIGQVLNNLLSNALKFTPDNGVITVTTTAQNKIITVSVKDNGVGVPAEKMALLFSKYGQLAGSIRKEGGTGLGLYISKEIVESHGGKIWLDSKPGQGTTVSFTIPEITTLPKEDTTTSVPHVPVSKVVPARALN